MKKQKNIRLTRKTAVELICSVLPVPKSSIQGGEVTSGVYIYEAAAGSFDVSCACDRCASNGLIRLTVHDRLGGSSIRMYFNPNTLERDFVAEEAYKADERREERIRWAQDVGRELAHRLVDQYCEALG